MSLIDLRYRLEDIYAGLKMSLNRRRAVVTSVAPLQIRFELSDDPLAGTPDTQVWPLAVGDLVHVLVQNRRALIIGKVRGSGASLSGDLRGTSAQRVALGLSGVMQDGMRFFDTDEKREYVWSSGEFRAADTGWIDLTSSLNSTYRGTLQGRRDGASIELLFIASSASFGNGSYVTIGTLPPEWRPAGTQNRRATVWFDNAYMGFGYVIPSSGAVGIVQSTGAARAGAQVNWMYTTN